MKRQSGLSGANLPSTEKRSTAVALPSLKPQICPSPRRVNMRPGALAAPLKLLLIHPDQAWREIRKEQLSATAIFEKYVFLLAAIGPVSGGIGFTASGRMTAPHALGYAAAAYGLILLFFFGATYFCHLLAPAFGGKLSLDNSAKLVVYSFMPFFVFLAFFLFPPICFLSLCGVYGIFLFYRGVPLLSTIPLARQLLYFTINAVTWIYFVEMMRCSVFRDAF